MDMKKYLVATLMTILLVGCGSVQSNETKAQTSFRFDFTHPQGTSSDFDVVIDHESGCKYLFYSNMSNDAAMTPLLKQDGTPDCIK
jgi:uncharacterized protein YcfL